MRTRTVLVSVLLTVSFLAGCFQDNNPGGDDNTKGAFTQTDCLSKDLRSVLTAPTTGNAQQGNVTLQTAFRALDDLQGVSRISLGITLWNATNNREEGNACLAGEIEKDNFLMSMHLNPTLVNATGGFGGQGGGALGAPSLNQALDILMAGRPDGMLVFIPGVSRAISSYHPPEKKDATKREPFWSGDTFTDSMPLLSPVGDLSEYRNFTITGYEATTLNGKPAHKVAFRGTVEEGTVQGVAILLDNPKRPAAVYVEFDHSLNPSSGGDDEGDDTTGSENPVPKGSALLVFRYDGDVVINLDTSLLRAMGLAVKQDFSYFGGQDRMKRNLTFSPMNDSARVPLSEAEFRIAKQKGSSGQPRAYEERDYEFKLPLDQRSKTEGNWSVTFTDKDNDGYVSRNDTVQVTYVGRVNNTTPYWSPFQGYDLGVYDETTRIFVTPGPGVPFALLGLVGMAAVLGLRRRRA